VSGACGHCGRSAEPNIRICLGCGRALGDSHAFRGAPQRTDRAAPGSGASGARFGAGNDRPIFDDSDREVFRLLKPQVVDIQSAFQTVCSSPHIQNNAAYAAGARTIKLRYAAESLQVNASASLDGRSGGLKPLVTYHAGWWLMMRCLAVSVVSCIDRQRSRLQSAALLGDAMQRCCRAMPEGTFDLQSLEPFAVAAEALESRGLSRARDLALAIDFEVMAHEVGHIVLHHIEIRGPQQESWEVSRNQERQADDFAASVLSTLPFREYVFLGLASSCMLWCWQEALAGAGAARTHPRSRERLDNALRANSQAAHEAAEAFGLTESFIRAALPPSMR